VEIGCVPGIGVIECRGDDPEENSETSEDVYCCADLLANAALQKVKKCDIVNISAHEGERSGLVLHATCD